LMNSEYPIKVRYIGKSSKLTMLNGKIYEARDCGLGWFALIDETNEEYAYPPNLFEVVETENIIQVEKKFIRIPKQAIKTVKARRIM